jgi:tetratricopeptide (TPR) repeat protein
MRLLTNHPDKALEDINESILIDAENPWAYRNKAIYYYMKGDDVNAERLFLQSIDMHNSISLSHFYLGNLMLRKGNQARACTEFLVSRELGELEGEKAHLQYCQ